MGKLMYVADVCGLFGVGTSVEFFALAKKYFDTNNKKYVGAYISAEKEGPSKYEVDGCKGIVKHYSSSKAYRAAGFSEPPFVQER